MSDSSDPFHVMGNDGIIRTLVEHYDGKKDVEQDTYGAWLAIQNQADRIEALEAERDALRTKLEAAVEAVDEMNCTAWIAHALEDGAISDKWAWIFEDVLQEQNHAIATLAKIKGEADD